MTLSSRIFLTVVFAGAAAIAFGCAAREIPPRYFVATVTAESQPVIPIKDEVRKVVQAAGALLETGRASVSFLPPPWCAGATDSPRAQREQKECLALIAALEKKAALSGYRVVDWRRLQSDPHNIAKKEAVDALFVIDDISINKTDTDGLSVTDVQVTEQISVDRRIPATLENRRIVIARCDGAIRARQRRGGEGHKITGLSLSLKMISPADGTAQWFYQHGESVENPIVTESSDYYYLSEGTKKTKKGKIAWGVTALSLGVAAVVSGVHLNEEGTSFATRNLGFGLAWVSILPLTIGLTMTMVGVVAQAKPPVYQSPDEVVCARPPFTENPFALQGVPDTARAEGDGSTLSDSVLQDKMADHFFAAVAVLQADTAGRPPEAKIPPAAEVKAPADSASVQVSSPPVQAPSPHIVIIKKNPDKQAIERKGGGLNE